MASQYSEDQVHNRILAAGLAALIEDAVLPVADPTDEPIDSAGVPFELWRVMWTRAVERIGRLHQLVRHGDIIGSKLKLRTDATRPMELDFLGAHEEGVFLLELKVDRAAERNAFSELFGYSNFVAGMFSMSGRKDVTNVLVAPLMNKITGQAYLYDLLVADRDVILYQPVYEDGTLDGLRLRLFVPGEDEFRRFANHLLSHEAMACLVVSFENVPGWIESAKEPGGEPPPSTLSTLAEISGHAAQLMEAEGLHGFCFVRKPWKEVEPTFQNSLIIVALNPFEFVRRDRLAAILDQVAPEHHVHLTEFAGLGFDSRLFDVGRRAFEETVGPITPTEFETPLWYGLVRSPSELVHSHNVGFRPTGIFREAFASYVQATYMRNEAVAARAEAGEERGDDYEIDVPTLRIDFLHNWFRAWEFMESWSPYREDGDDDAPMREFPGEDADDRGWPAIGRRPTFG